MNLQLPHEHLRIQYDEYTCVLTSPGTPAGRWSPPPVLRSCRSAAPVSEGPSYRRLWDTAPPRPRRNALKEQKRISVLCNDRSVPLHVKQIRSDAHLAGTASRRAAGLCDGWSADRGGGIPSAFAPYQACSGSVWSSGAAHWPVRRKETLHRFIKHKDLQFCADWLLIWQHVDE